MQVIELQKNISLLLQQCVLNLSIFATFENKGCCVQMSGVLYKKVFSYKSAPKTLHIYISHFSEIFVEISYIVLKIQRKLYR